MAGTYPNWLRVQRELARILTGDTQSATGGRDTRAQRRSMKQTDESHTDADKSQGKLCHATVAVAYTSVILRPRVWDSGEEKSRISCLSCKEVFANQINSAKNVQGNLTSLWK